MPDFYNIAAARGRTVGQGLMGMGQVVSGALESRRRAKERKKARQFTQGVSIIGMYVKVAEHLPEKQRMEFMSGTLLPMIAKIGGFDEKTKQEDISQGLATLMAQSKEDRQGFMEDLYKVRDLMVHGKVKEAKEFFNATIVPQYTGKFKKTKPIFDHFRTWIDNEETYSRTKAGKEEQRKYETTKEINKGVLAGELERVPTGQEGAFPGRPIVDYGKRGGLVAGLSEKQKTERAAEKAGAIAKAKEKPEKITEKGKANARKRISQIEKDYVNLKSKGVNTKGLKLLSPDARALISAFKGQKLSEDDLKYIREIYDKEIQALVDTHGLTEYTKTKSISWKDYQ
jgi:hypothetical protein